jgi:hypothetical protein
MAYNKHTTARACKVALACSGVNWIEFPSPTMFEAMDRLTNTAIVSVTILNPRKRMDFMATSRLTFKI